MAVAIVVHERAASIPALSVAGDPSFLGVVGKCAIAVVVVKDILAEVGYEEVVETVVVVIADTDALSPARVNEASFESDVSEGAVTIVFEEVVCGFLARRKAFEACAVDEENVEPAVVVEIVEGDAAAGGFQQIFVLVFAAEGSFGIEARFARDIEEGDAEISGGSHRGRGPRIMLARGGPACRKRTGQLQNLLEGEDERGAAERLEKSSSSESQKSSDLFARKPY